MTITNDTPIAALTVQQFKELFFSTPQPRAERPKPETLIFGLNECSEFTGYSKSAIYARTSTNAIPFFKRDGKILFRRDEILDWLQEGKKPDLTSELDAKLLKRKTGK